MLNLTDSSKAHPVIIDVNIFPSPPIPIENVTLIVGLENNSYFSVDEIRLISQEYIYDVSFPETYNISLNYNYSCCMDFYKGTFKLAHKDATRLIYHLEIFSNGTWYKYNTSFFDMVVNSNENISNNKENQTPGFEFIMLIFSAILFLITRNYKLKVKK